jgi:hypothetical protein
MHKISSLIVFCSLALTALAQTPPTTITVNQKIAAEIPTTQPYGKIDIADLELKECDFEKDANAEVLFDKGTFTSSGFERHVRIKIFNDFGKQVASFRLPGGDSKAIDAETFNLVNGKIEITPIDKKLIYIEKTNSFGSTAV